MSKWPPSIVRWLRQGSTGGFAIKLGWVVVKATLVNFLCRYAFDRACKELDMVYRESAGIGTSLPQGHAAGGQPPL